MSDLVHQRWTVNPPTEVKGERAVIYRDRLPEGINADYVAEFLDAHDLVVALAWCERDLDLSVAYPGKGPGLEDWFSVRLTALDPSCIWARKNANVEAILREWRAHRREMGDVVAFTRAHYLMGAATWHLPPFEVAVWPDDYNRDGWGD